MTKPDADPLLVALQVVAGLRDPDPALPSAWLDRARSLLNARQRVLDDPGCPPAVRRRAEALFAARPEGLLAEILRLVFDSRQEPVGAIRGAGHARSLRFEGESSAIDIRLEDVGSTSLRVEIAVESGRSEWTAVVVGSPDGAGAETSTVDPVALDEEGTGELLLSPPPASLEVLIRDGTHDVLRTPLVRLE